MFVSTPKPIQPLPSHYDGTLFRSRLEARWAYFFDLIKLAWDYEPEGFALPAGNYCPDFFLPEWKLFVELKPTQEAVDAIAEKLQQLASATGCAVMGIAGPPSPKSQRIFAPSGKEHVGGIITGYAVQKGWGSPYYASDDMGELWSDPEYLVARRLQFDRRGYAKV